MNKFGDDILNSICREKKLNYYKEVESIVICENKNNFNYTDIIGFYYVINDLTNWKSVEANFIKEVENILVDIENQCIIEPYLIFIIDNEKYIDNLEDIVKIEKDDFYCRKFVYPFKDKQSIISKLPFGNPMEYKIKRDNFLSAEKTLLSLGMDRKNAQLLLSKTLSEKAKLEMIEYFNEFKIENKDVDSVVKSKDIKKSVYLKEMKIQGFRIYGKEQIFDLDADLIVLYGSNGLGKTSFFDAFEYCITGEVKRFSDRRGDIDSNLLKNFLVDNSESKVGLKFHVISNNDEDYDKVIEVKRRIGESTVSIIQEDKERKEQTKELISKITQKNIDLKKEEVVRLFRATHINNQEDSELTESAIKGASSISNEILGRMISFEDYIAAEDNLRKIINKQDDKIKDINPRLTTLENEIAVLKKQYELQKETLINQKNSEIYNKQKKKLSNELRKNGFTDVKELEKHYIENQLINEIEYEQRCIENKIKDVDELKFMRREITSLENGFSKLNIGKINSSIKDIEKKVDDIKICQNSINLEKEDLLAELKGKEILHNEYYVYRDIYEKIQKSTQYIKQLSEQKENKKSEQIKLQSLNSEISKQSNEMKKKILELDKLLYFFKDRIEEIGKVILNFDNYSKFKENNGSYVKLLEETVENKNSLIKQLEEASKEIRKYNYEISSLEQEIKNDEKKNNEFENLLLSIKQFVNSNVCPVCSAHHEEEGDIVKKIDEKIQNVSQVQIKKLEILNNLKGIRDKRIVSSNKIQNNLNELESEIIRLRREQEKEKVEIEKFEIKLNQLNLTNNKEQIKKISEDLQCEHEEIIKGFNFISDNKKRLDKEYTENYKLIVNLNEEIKNFSEIILKETDINNSWENSLVELQFFQSFNEINLSEKGGLNNFIEKIDEETVLLKTQVEKCENECSVYKSDKNKLEKELLLFKQKLEKEMKKEIRIDNLKSKLNSYLKSHSITEIADDKLESLKEDLEKKHQGFSLLKADVFSFVKLIEYETLSIEQKKLKLELEFKEKEKDELLLEKDMHTKINKNINMVIQVLRNVQQDIVGNYCKTIEPLVSVIQSRLRTLYGFTDLNLLPDKENNEVKITNSHYALDESNELKPYKYLSEAQKNIIRLSLFLSTTLSQNWSGLKTIFFDDPVQHFDDLNAYAFLELLKSIVLSKNENEKKQIIISTCDIQLFNLIREKFSMLKECGRAKFYCFESMNKEGPIIKKV